MLRKFVICMILMAMIFNSSLSSIYASNSDVDTARDVAYEYYTRVRSDVQSEDMDVESVVPIFNFDETIRGYVFVLKDLSGNSGYINVSQFNGEPVVVEASFDGYPQQFDNEEKLYYCGALTYLTKNDGYYFDERTGEQITLTTDRKVISEVFHAQRNSSKMVVQGDFYYYSVSGSMPAILQSVNGKCVPAATAVLLSYYKNQWGYSDLVSYSGTTLRDTYYQKLNTVTGKTGGFNFNDVKITLPSFVSSSYNVSVSYYTAELNNQTLNSNHINTVINRINANKPVLVIVGSDAYRYSSQNVIQNTGTLHALTVKGVRYRYQGSGDHYLVAVDPWNGNTVDLIWDVANSSSRQYFAIFGIGLVNITRK